MCPYPNKILSLDKYFEEIEYEFFFIIKLKLMYIKVNLYESVLISFLNEF